MGLARALALSALILAIAPSCSQPAPGSAPGGDGSRPLSEKNHPSPTLDPSPPAPVEDVSPTVPVWNISTIGPTERDLLMPRNWRRGCPVPLESLRWLTVTYQGFDGEVKAGPLVVNERVAEDVLWVFRRLFRADFQIRHIALPARYHPHAKHYDWTRSVTSGFNCRPVTDTRHIWSQHSYGWAIDLNPLQNPYVRSDGSVLRHAAKPYRDRSLDLPGMIGPGDVAVRSFAAIGWGWGGNWNTLKDYMHFSLIGR